MEKLKALELTDNADRLSSEVELKLRIVNLEIDSPPATTDLDPLTKDFSVGRTTFGEYTVSVENSTPYLNGYKVILRIGNLTSATLTGADMKISWTAGSSPQSTELHPTANFEPGRFTEVEVILSPAAASDLNTMNLALEFKGVQMRIPEKRQ